MFHMTYTVLMVRQSSLDSDCIGAGTEDFNTLEDARAFAQSVLPKFSGKYDQLVIEHGPYGEVVETFR